MTNEEIERIEGLLRDARCGVPIEPMRDDDGSLSSGDRAVGVVNISGSTHAQDRAVAKWLAAISSAAPTLLAELRRLREVEAAVVRLGEARAMQGYAVGVALKAANEARALLALRTVERLADSLADAAARGGGG